MTKIYFGFCFAVLLVSLSVSSAFADAPSKKELAKEINEKCLPDAKAASCKDKKGEYEKFGGGLLKCLWAYKKDHPEFKVSEGCKASMKGMRRDHPRKNAKPEGKAKTEK